MTKVAETAKALRQALKTTFPGVKFRVRSKRYPFDTIRIDYTDGPTTVYVAAVVIGLGKEAYETTEHVFIRREDSNGGSESRFCRKTPLTVADPWMPY